MIIRIDALAFGGAGVGCLEGQAVFVPLTVPGDLARCRLVRQHKRHLEAELLEILEPGPGRRMAPCPVFGSCGGCQWQHLDYPVQAEWKHRLLEGSLQRQAGLETPEVLLDFMPAAEEWGYRTRIQLKCHTASGRPSIGFFRRGSHFVIDIPACPIAHPRLNAAIPLVRDILAAAPHPELVPQVDLGVGDDDSVRLVVHSITPPSANWRNDLKQLAEVFGCSLFLQVGRKSTLSCVLGPEDLMLQVDEPPLSLAYGPGGFAQVNQAQNRALVQQVVAAAGLTGGERVLDLFCGMGNFSLPLARRAESVVGVEDYAPSIAKAEQNARDNGVQNVRFLARPAQDVLAQAISRGQAFDLVLLDPPRSGAFLETKLLTKLCPQRILYVSCDPATLSRDLKVLTHGGYRLRSCRGFDLFPQTYHLESLAVLDLRE